MISCPLCSNSKAITLFHKDKKREYYHCPECHLTAVPSRYFLSKSDELAEYETHENSPQSAGYRKFLNRLFIPLSEQLKPQSRGLDFGSGPGPTLSVMFEDVGHRMTLYDPFYAPQRDVLSRQYDFVTATEVVEHFQSPAEDLKLLWSLVKPGGCLGIMTAFRVDSEAFEQWHYKRDMTHVAFYSEETMRWLGKQWGVEPFFYEKGVTLFFR